MGPCGDAVRRDDNAFAGRQPVVFDHPGGLADSRTEPVQRRIQTCWVVDDLAGGGANPRRCHDVLGKGLGTLDLRRGLARPETDNAGVAHGIGHPEYERNFGPDDHQVGPDLAGQCDHVVSRRDVHSMLVGQRGGTGVAGRDGQRFDLGICAQRKQQGMFPGTGADHQNAHEKSL